MVISEERVRLEICDVIVALVKHSYTPSFDQVNIVDKALCLKNHVGLDHDITRQIEEYLNNFFIRNTILATRVAHKILELVEMSFHQDFSQTNLQLRTNLTEVLLIHQRTVVVRHLLCVHCLVVLKLIERNLRDVVDFVVRHEVLLHLLVISLLLLLEGMDVVRSGEDGLESLVDNREDNQARHLHRVNQNLVFIRVSRGGLLIAVSHSREGLNQKVHHVEKCLR